MEVQPAIKVKIYYIALYPIIANFGTRTRLTIAVGFTKERLKIWYEDQKAPEAYYEEELSYKATNQPWPINSQILEKKKVRKYFKKESPLKEFLPYELEGFGTTFLVKDNGVYMDNIEQLKSLIPKDVILLE